MQQQPKQCKRCGDFTETGYVHKGKWICDECHERREAASPTRDRFRETEEALIEHRRSLGIYA